MVRITDDDQKAYLMLFKEGRDVFSDKVLNLALSHGGILRLMYEDKKPAGYVILDRDGDEYWLSYAFTMLKKRHRGIFTDLIKDVLKSVTGRIRFSVATDSEEYPVIRAVAEKLGFEEGRSSSVFSLKKADVLKWESYKKKQGNLLMEAIERQGFKCFSFRQAGDDILRQLIESAKNEFQNRLPVKGFILNSAQNTDFDCSFVSVKDGKIAAYTLMTKQDAKSLVCEQNSTAERYIGTGCIMQPFLYMIEAFARAEFERVIFTIYDDNQAAQAFRRKIAKIFDFTGQKFVNYIYVK